MPDLGRSWNSPRRILWTRLVLVLGGRRVKQFQDCLVFRPRTSFGQGMPLWTQRWGFGWLENGKSTRHVLIFLVVEIFWNWWKNQAILADNKNTVIEYTMRFYCYFISRRCDASFGARVLTLSSKPSCKTSIKSRGSSGASEPNQARVKKARKATICVWACLFHQPARKNTWLGW